MEKLHSELRYHIESLVRKKSLMDNRNLIYHATKRSFTNKQAEDWSYRRKATMTRKIIREMCHEGILFVFYKYTRDGDVSLLITHKDRINSIIKRAKDLLAKIEVAQKQSEFDKLDRRIIDILIYMGELAFREDLVQSVVIDFESCTG
ncbi:MAG: hypothetical protein ACFFER_13200 [Candidatus Thorarchaeota archaeon]